MSSYRGRGLVPIHSPDGPAGNGVHDLRACSACGGDAAHIRIPLGLTREAAPIARKGRRAGSRLALGALGGFIALVLVGVPSVAASGALSFASAVNYATGNGFPIEVALSDLNRDAKPDLAVANGLSNEVSVLLGNGDGTFGAAANFHAGAGNLRSLAVGDLSGDGVPDVAVANGNQTYISVLLGTGDGSLGAPVTYGVHFLPSSVAISDLNGDAKPDLAVPNSLSNDVSVLLGNGDGSFRAATNFAAHTRPFALVVGDLNSDGKPDLAVANVTSEDVSVLLGNGDGSFRAATNFSAHTRPHALALGDLNGDGRADLAVGNGESNDVSVLLGTGDGSFQPAVNYPVSAGVPGENRRSVALGDLNGDGKPDLAVSNLASNDVSLLIGNGDGSFQTAVSYGANREPTSVAIGDLNADGRRDLAIANSDSNDVSVLLNTTGTATVSLAAGPTAVSPGGFVTATWADLVPVEGEDLISLHKAGATDHERLSSEAISGVSGTVSLDVPDEPGTYELRLFNNSVKVATSNTFTVVAVKLTVSPRVLLPGAPVTGTWIDFVDQERFVLIGLYAPGADDLDYTDSRGHVGMLATWTFTAPTTPGTYELRLLHNGVRAARSETFTVVAVSLTASPAAVAPGAAVKATWANLVPSGNDWISMHRADAPDGPHTTFELISGASGTANLTAPIVPGDYVLRLYRDGTSVATSNAFTVHGVSLFATPGEVNTGAPVTATWANLAPSGNDWISMHRFDASDRDHLTFEPITEAAGLVRFTAPTTPGLYQFRMFRNGEWVGKSEPFMVTAVTLSASPAVVNPRGVVTATWANLVPVGHTWISIHQVGSPDANFAGITAGLAAGTGTQQAPEAPGNYELRMYRLGDSGNLLRLATSTAFTIRAVSLSVGPALVNPRGVVTATWANLVPVGHTWISIHQVGSPDANFAGITAGLAAGTGTQQAPEAPGNYELRMYRLGDSGNLLRLATSTAFAVRVVVVEPPPAAPDPPRAPTEIHLANSTETTITIAWDDQSSDETSFEVRYSRQGSPQVIVTLQADTLQRTGSPTEGYDVDGTTSGGRKTWVKWEHSGLAFNSLYSYEVRACRSTACSPWRGLISGWARKQWDDPSNFTELDYGIYWFRCGRCRISFAGDDRLPMLEENSRLVSRSDGIKAIGGEAVSEYYDPSKPTMIYVHGYQPKTVIRRFRESFNFTTASMREDYDLVGAWKARGWNVGIFYWNQWADDDGALWNKLPLPFISEAKIWTTDDDHAKRMRWRRSFVRNGKYDASFGSVPSGIRGWTASALFLEAYEEALAENTSRNIRVVGHSLGNQMAVKMTYDLLADVNSKLVPSRLLPKRVALLDPFYSPFDKQFLSRSPWRLGWPVHTGDRVAEYIGELKKKGILFEYYQTTNIENLLVTAEHVKAATVYSRVHPDYEPIHAIPDAHAQGIYWYMMSMGFDDPPAHTWWLGEWYDAGTAPSARTSNERIKTLMGESNRWEQKWGLADPSLVGDEFERQRKILG